MNYNASIKATALGLAVALGSAVASMPMSAKAATVFYTDRKAWESAVPSFSLEEFNRRTPNVDSFTFDDVDVTSTGTPTSAPPNQHTRNRVNLDGQFDALIINDDPARFNTITWTFGDSDVIGFFAEFFSVEDGMMITGNYDGGASIDLFSVLGGAMTNTGEAEGGFGVISDTAFDSITYSFTGSGDSSFRVDDLAVAVPTPALLPGLVGMGVAALRKKKDGEIAEEV